MFPSRHQPWRRRGCSRSSRPGNAPHPAWVPRPAVVEHYAAEQPVDLCAGSARLPGELSVPGRRGRRRVFRRRRRPSSSLRSRRSRGPTPSFAAEDQALARARRRGREVSAVPVGPGGGAALRVLAAAIDARTVVEIGTGAGVSGLYLLAGMRPDSVLTGVDIESEHQRLAREAFAEVGVAHSDPADHRRSAGGPAALTDGAYDLVFCDGDKPEYADYLRQALRLLRPGCRRLRQCPGTTGWPTPRSVTPTRSRSGLGRAVARTNSSCRPCFRWVTACSWLSSTTLRRTARPRRPGDSTVECAQRHAALTGAGRLARGPGPGAVVRWPRGHGRPCRSDRGCCSSPAR